MAKERLFGKAKEGKKGFVVSATLPKEQYEAVRRLEGSLGTGYNGVVANIISMWLYSQDWFLEIIKNKIKQKSEK